MVAEAERLAELRELLPATGAGIYLDTARRGPLPAEAAAAMREADEWELRVGRVTAGREEDVAQRDAEARAVIAALIGGQPDEVLLVSGLGAALELAQRFVGDARVLDASDLVGAVPVLLDELQAGAVVFACDRWLLGPEGTAAAWLSPAARATGQITPPDPLPRTTLIGLARSVGWLEMYVGLDWIYERTTRLARRLYDALAAIDGVEPVAPADELPAIVTFRVAGWPATEAAEQLGRRVFALLSAVPESDALRASVGWFNSEEELDRFAGAVAELAAHTPATLPQRPRLELL
jgi:selenocysteine lyase/cysteine desulfurase